MDSIIIEDTYAEAFRTKAAYLLITAATKELAYTAAVEATGLQRHLSVVLPRRA